MADTLSRLGHGGPDGSPLTFSEDERWQVYCHFDSAAHEGLPITVDIPIRLAASTMLCFLDIETVYIWPHAKALTERSTDCTMAGDNACLPAAIVSQMQELRAFVLP
jgi:hypothetical protein